jgi:hypothetical protein
VSVRPAGSRCGAATAASCSIARAMES